MTSTWDADGDFGDVVDTLEEVTLRRSGCDDTVSTSAWRFSDESSGLEGAGDAVTVVETVWQTPIGTTPWEPAVGDRLIDAAGVCSTLYRVERYRGATRLRCRGRRLTIAAIDAEWFALEQAVWDLEVSTDAPVGWRVERPALRGHAFRVATAASSADPSAAEERHRIVLTDPIEATPNHRFRSRAGSVYRVTEQDVELPLGGGWVYETIKE